MGGQGGLDWTHPSEFARARELHTDFDSIEGMATVSLLRSSVCVCFVEDMSGLYLANGEDAIERGQPQAHQAKASASPAAPPAMRCVLRGIFPVPLSLLPLPLPLLAPLVLAVLDMVLLILPGAVPGDAEFVVKEEEDGLV